MDRFGSSSKVQPKSKKISDKDAVRDGFDDNSAGNSGNKWYFDIQIHLKEAKQLDKWILAVNDSWIILLNDINVVKYWNAIINGPKIICYDSINTKKDD